MRTRHAEPSIGRAFPPSGGRSTSTLASPFILLLLLLLLPGIAAATTLTSTSYQHVGGSTASISAVSGNALTSSAITPAIGSFEIVVGEAPTVRPSGSATDLTTVHPGFFARFRGTQGGFATLDLDGDLRAFFLDADDDGDGLDDVVETATGLFLSLLNTGTSPFDDDSDGDGFGDGVEALAGTDPNDPFSLPAAAVPSAGVVSLGLLLGGLLLMGVRAVNGGRRRVSC